MPHTELRIKSKIVDYRGAENKCLYGATSGNAILKDSVFQRDLNESNVTADIMLYHYLS